MTVGGLRCRAVLLVTLLLAGCGKQADRAIPLRSDHDIDRVVRLEQEAVYHGFDDNFPISGTLLARDVRDGEGNSGKLTLDIDNLDDDSIELRAVFDDNGPAFSIRLAFEKVDQGKHTRVMADVDVRKEVAAANHADPEETRRYIVRRFNRVIDDIVARRRNRRDITRREKEEDLRREAQKAESRRLAGKPYAGPVPKAEESLVEPGRDFDNPAGIPMRNGKVVPMQTGEPMVDPQETVRRHTHPHQY